MLTLDAFNQYELMLINQSVDGTTMFTTIGRHAVQSILGEIALAVDTMPWLEDVEKGSGCRAYWTITNGGNYLQVQINKGGFVEGLDAQWSLAIPQDNVPSFVEALKRWVDFDFDEQEWDAITIGGVTQ